MGVRGAAANNHHKLDPLDRRICGWLGAMDLWQKKDIAEVFGVHVRTVRKHELTYGGEVWESNDAATGRAQVA